MLVRRTVFAAIAILALLLAIIAAPDATAGRECWKELGKVVCRNTGSGTGGTNPVSNPAGTAECQYKGKTVACTEQSGWFHSGRNCYVGPLVMDTRERNHETWELHPCIAPDGGGLPPVWVPPNPPPPPPPPPVLAAQLFEQMPITDVNIGVTPYPGGLGLLGLPTYLWVKNPAASFGEHAIGPLCVRGLCVQGSSTIDKVVWRMGDGSVETCPNAGTAYQDHHGRDPSPTCGHRYKSPGEYTVEATTDWTFHWSGGGVTGTIPAQTTSTVTIEIGEAQAVGR